MAAHCAYPLADHTRPILPACFDSLLAFNLDSRKFEWGFHLQRQYEQWTGHTFDPRTDTGPRPVNDFHINTVHVDKTGIFLSGLGTNALLHIDSKQPTLAKL